MSFLQKIQGLPERKRRIILWVIVIIVSLISLIFWITNIQEKFKNFPKEELKEQFKEMPKIEMPEISEEELKKLETYEK